MNLKLENAMIDELYNPDSDKKDIRQSVCMEKLKLDDHINE